MTETLNESQARAVTSTAPYILVLAGAGSGKTRVLVQRIASLIQTHHVSPFSILAVTFTNKAASEMRARIESTLQLPSRGMWIGTFHGLAHRFLRSHWQEAGLNEQFQILDSEDQQRLIKRILKQMNLDDKHYPPRQVQGFINHQKEQGRRANQVQDTHSAYAKIMQQVYQTYEDVCARSFLVDFSELLLRAYETLRDNEALLAHYQERFKHILIDEFQDTNTLQYAWIKLLAGDKNQLMVVGDDDQSIYSWRGAKIENINRFSHDFDPVEVIRLEQNYRSTATILQAANGLIANNAQRMGKELWTHGEQGEPIMVYEAFNELDEAQFIVGRIKAWIEKGNAAQDVAVLYRSNMQSRVIEEALLRAGIGYRVYGGLRFFERGEIKDALAYLRLMANREDDASFERVVNFPTRGIGDKTVDLIRSTARSQYVSLWQAASVILDGEDLTARAKNALQGFLALINQLDSETHGLPLSDQIDAMLTKSGLHTHYSQMRGEKAQAKVENLDELVTAGREFTIDEDAPPMPLLAAFLSHASLEAGDQQDPDTHDHVQLMTAHSAKGLEFPFVIVAGLEEGLFPHFMSLEADDNLEEERRLCYVAMTRAEMALMLTYAQSRRIHGTAKYHRPSRFIQEIPKETLQFVRARGHGQAPSRGYSGGGTWQRGGSSAAGGLSHSVGGFAVGQTVRHGVFGEGTVLNFEGSGPQARIQVQFEAHGAKWLVLSFAKLEPVG